MKDLLSLDASEASDLAIMMHANLARESPDAELPSTELRVSDYTGEGGRWHEEIMEHLAIQYLLKRIRMALFGGIAVVVVTGKADHGPPSYATDDFAVRARFWLDLGVCDG